MTHYAALALLDVAPPTSVDSLPSSVLVALGALGALGALLVIVLLVRRGPRR